MHPCLSDENGCASVKAEGYHPACNECEGWGHGLTDAEGSTLKKERYRPRSLSRSLFRDRL